MKRASRDDSLVWERLSHVGAFLSEAYPSPIIGTFSPSLPSAIELLRLDLLGLLLPGSLFFAFEDVGL